LHPRNHSDLVRDLPADWDTRSHKKESRVRTEYKYMVSHHWVFHSDGRDTQTLGYYQFQVEQEHKFVQPGSPHC